VDQPEGAGAPRYDAATLRFYAKEAPSYTGNRPSSASRHLAGFLDRLPPGARLLDLGCGGGRDSDAMIRRGFIVDPVDGSAEMARQAEERIGRAVRVMRFDQLDAAGIYDGVWAHASLLHVPRPMLLDVLVRIFRALRPGGFHFANFKGGGREGRDRLGRYYNYLDEAELLDLYRASGGWEIVATEEYVGRGYDGSENSWTALTLRKPG
jgi:SAM-dependent methyltransferase